MTDADKLAMLNGMAQEWLIREDPEAANYWSTRPLTTDFLAAMEDNLRDFGDDDVGLVIMVAAYRAGYTR